MCTVWSSDSVRLALHEIGGVRNGVPGRFSLSGAARAGPFGGSPRQRLHSTHPIPVPTRAKLELRHYFPYERMVRSSGPGQGDGGVWADSGIRSPWNFLFCPSKIAHSCVPLSRSRPLPLPSRERSLFIRRSTDGPVEPQAMPHSWCRREGVTIASACLHPTHASKVRKSRTPNCLCSVDVLFLGCTGSARKDNCEFHIADSNLYGR